MYQRYYDGYDSCILKDEALPEQSGTLCISEKTDEIALCKNDLGAFASLAVDDIILLGVLILLLLEGSDDRLLFIIIGALLFAGKFDIFENI